MPATKSGQRSTDQRYRGYNASSTWLPVTIVIVLGALLGGGYWFGKRNYVPTDDETLCRTDQPPPSLSIVLIDVTETLSQGEQVQILNEIDRIRDTIPRFGRFEVYALGRIPSDIATARVAMCNPGRGAEVSELYANPGIVEERWQRNFANRLTQALAGVVSESAGDQSLILEGIRTIALENFGRAAYDTVPKQLWVFSDFLQNVPGVYSQYTQPLLSYQSFRSTPYAAQIETSLRDITVSAFYISRPRTDALQTKEHITFWIDYFATNGATVNSIKQIFGD